MGSGSATNWFKTSGLGMSLWAAEARDYRLAKQERERGAESKREAWARGTERETGAAWLAISVWQAVE